MSMPKFSIPGLSHLHGSNYTEEQFNAEVEARSLNYYEEGMPDEDVKNIFFNVSRDVFAEFNNLDPHDPRTMEYQREMTMKQQFGHQTVSEMQASGSGLLDPVHGVTLDDFAAANAKIASGANIADILKVLGVEQPQWDEANTIWNSRMASDTTYSIVTAYGNAFTNSNIGKFANSDVGMAVQADSQQKAAVKESLELYAEIFSAQSTAYEYGMDGSQYVKDKWGITLGDWGEIGSHWMKRSSDDIQMLTQLGELTDKYTIKYKEEFAAAQGGNAGDDISF